MTVVAERIGTWEPGSPAWHAARAHALGASEISAVVGLSPWESLYSMWHRKAGFLPPLQETEEMRWGHYLEAPIAQRFADEHPELRVTRTGTYRSIERSWQLCNPDRLARKRGGGSTVPVEVKWSYNSDGWGPSGSDQIPVYYRCQLMQQMDVLGAPYGWLAALVGAEFREYLVDYHRDDALLLRDAGAAFMASLPSEWNPDGDPPDIDDSPHTYRALKQLHPDVEDREQEIPDVVADLYRLATEYAKGAEAAAQKAKNHVLAAMGPAKRAVTADGERVAMRVARSGSIALMPTKQPKQPKTSVKEAVA